jgi:hypothetical protein
MRGASFLVWLVSLVALIVPPVATGHAMPLPHSAASADCPGHAPPPVPCPDHGTAKHATGECCALMAPMLALLSETPVIDAKFVFRVPMPEPPAGFTGRIVTQDPPPPRT